jgi:hypothetical protein
MSEIPGLECVGGDPTSEGSVDSPALRVLRIMAERGIQSEEVLKHWKAMTSRINSVAKFSALVEDAACNGWFDVERVIDSFSFVAFLRMSKFAAKVIAYVVNTYPFVRRFLQTEGICFLAFDEDSKLPFVDFHQRKHALYMPLHPKQRAGTISSDTYHWARRSDAMDENAVTTETGECDSGSEPDSISCSILSQAQTGTALSCISEMDMLSDPSVSDPFSLNEARFSSYADALKTCWHVLGSDVAHATEIRDIFLKYRIKIGGEDHML